MSDDEALAYGALKVALRQAGFANAVAALDALEEAVGRQKARAERAEQKSAELAAVIAEARATKPGGFNDTPRLGAILRILSAVPADVLSAYTTRIREEAVVQSVEALDALPERTVVMDGGGEVWRKLGNGRWDCLDANPDQPTEDSRTVLWQSRDGHATVLWSEIPEGQTP